jgi:hypothetical protein
MYLISTIFPVLDLSLYIGVNCGNPNSHMIVGRQRKIEKLLKMIVSSISK